MTDYDAILNDDAQTVWKIQARSGNLETAYDAIRQFHFMNYNRAVETVHHYLRLLNGVNNNAFI